MPDNWYERTKRHKAHVAEAAELKTQLEAERVLRVEFEEWLEAERPHVGEWGVLSRQDLMLDDFIDDAQQQIASLKAKHIENKSGNQIDN